MFKILDRYIGKTIFLAIVITLIMLVGLSAIIKFVEQFRDVGRGNYDGIQALYYTLLTIPRDIETFFPMAVLLGVLMGLGSLASNSELTVMQSSGFSRFSVGLSVIKTTMPLVILVLIAGEWGIPQTEQFARNMRSQAISGGELLPVKYGVWAKDDNKFIYIEQLHDDNTLKNVYIYEFDNEQRLQGIQFANQATYDEQNKIWNLNHVNKTTIFADRVENENTFNQSWISSITPDKLVNVRLKASSLSTTGLKKYAEFLKQSGQDASQFELLYWIKIVQPLSITVMILLSLSFIFGPLRNVTAGARIVAGILSGFTFYVINETFGKIGMVFTISPIVSAVIPSLLFFVLSVWLLQRKRG